jgi:uncharacterized protein (DUF885 family)
MTTEKNFNSKAELCIEELMQNSPVSATFMGDHRFDEHLSDNSPEGINKIHKWSVNWLHTFEQFETKDWSKNTVIDLTIMIQVLKNLLRGLEKTRTHERYPGNAPDECLGGIYALVVREFAPLPVRLKSILGRLNEVPRVLSEVRGNIITKDVPEIWAKASIESTRQGVGLFSNLIPMLAESSPEIMDEIILASHKAADAMNDYASWIENEILPEAQGNFAVGKELFDEMLREDHMVSYDADELRQTGWSLFEDTDRQMRELAARIDATRSVTELLEQSKGNHPTAQGLLDAYRFWMNKARQFVIDHEIASIPEGESIRIVETPPFQRMFIPYAAYNMPGFFEKNQEGIFWVTPVDENASSEEIERKLRGHPWADIPVTALHEAYPGHHLQLVVSNTIPSLPRKLGSFLSSLFIEGWAFYCEELMEQMGFIDQPIQKLARLQAQIWRASRIIIDTSLHCGQMTVTEAETFLVERAGLEPDDAKAEVLRYTMSPTQPQCYLMGKLQILEIITEYKQKYPKSTLRQMHDHILKSGSLPPKLMKQNLFNIKE